jgi:GTP-binding protein
MLTYAVISPNRAGEKVDTGRVTKILTRQGDKGVVSMDTAVTGDVIQLAGLSKATVADTICSPEVTKPLPTQSIDPPTVCMTFGPKRFSTARPRGKDIVMVTNLYVCRCQGQDLL